MKKIILLIILLSGFNFLIAETESDIQYKPHIKKINFTEKDGDIVVISMSRNYKKNKTFFLNFTNLSCECSLPDVFNSYSNSPDATVLVAYTNTIGELNITITNAQNYDNLSIRVRQKKSAGNKIIDIKKIEIDNAIKNIKIGGNLETLHCGKIRNLKILGKIDYVAIKDNKNVQYSTRNIQYSIRKIQVGQLSNSFIMTGVGGIKLLRVKKDIFKTTILTGTKYFGETESETECGINKIIVGESIEQSGIFPGPTGYDSEKSWTNATSSIKKIKVGKRKYPGQIQNTTFISQKTNTQIRAIITTNVLFNGIILEN